MSLLEKAIKIALQKHEGQKDKAGKPYILHPLRVMLQLASEMEMTAGILHDTIEDTDLTLNDLKQQGFPQEIIDAVDLLTHHESEKYEDYIEKIKSNDLARKVKLADLKDNMDYTRIPELKQKDLDRLGKYHRAWKELILVV